MKSQSEYEIKLILIVVSLLFCAVIIGVSLGSKYTDDMCKQIILDKVITQFESQEK